MHSHLYLLNKPKEQDSKSDTDSIRGHSASKLRREHQRRQKPSEDTLSDSESVGSVESDEPRKKLKTLLREKGFTFMIDDQRRVDGEIRSWPEEFDFEDIVKINVGGLMYETRRSTLKRFPNTLLGSDGIERFYCKSRDLYFIDRHRSAFGSILSYYQSGGLLSIPTTIHPLVFLEEARFYALGTRIINKLEQPFFVRKTRTVGTMKQKIWYTLDDPASSSIAKGVAFFDLGCIITAIALICIKSLERFDPARYHKDNPHHDPTNIQDGYEAVFFVLETICMIWFTMDLFLRFCVCPNKLDFCKNILNWVDVVSVVPFYLELMVPSNVQVLLVIRIIRFTKIFRIFKLSRHFRGLIALGLALKHSVSEILVLFVFLFVAVLFFATVGYFSEAENDESDFTSVISSFWWAIVTITSVGYGDQVPKTCLGRLTGALCAITGIIFVALPVPIIVSRFNYFLQLENEKCRIGADEDISIFKHPLYSSEGRKKKNPKKRGNGTSDSGSSQRNKLNNGDRTSIDVESGLPSATVS